MLIEKIYFCIDYFQGLYLISVLLGFGCIKVCFVGRFLFISKQEDYCEFNKKGCCFGYCNEVFDQVVIIDNQL